MNFQTRVLFFGLKIQQVGLPKFSNENPKTSKEEDTRF